MKILVEKALKDGKALWPGRFPVELLEKRRQEMGTMIFNLQYQNDAQLALGAVFREEWFRFYRHAPDELAIYQGVDLAISSSKAADYFAIVTVGRNEQSEFYVLDVFRGRLTFEQQAQAIVRKANEFKPVRVAIEATGYQAAMAQVLRSKTAVPVRAVYPHKNKMTRALRLSASFENGKVFLRRNQEMLMEELLQFPDGEHDDLFDALEMAMELAGRSFAGKLLKIPGV